MKNGTTKISLFILIGLIIVGCNSTRRVPNGKSLLTKNTIFVDGKKNNLEEVSDKLYQKENSSILGYPLRLNIYNLAQPHNDSVFKAKFINNPKKYDFYAKILSRKQVKRLGESFWYSGIHNFLRKSGEPPVILDTAGIKKSLTRLKSYYFNKGYFDVTDKNKIDSLAPKKVKLRYDISRGKPYMIDSIKTSISSQPLDSIYQLRKKHSFLKSRSQFDTKNFEEEKTRITSDFRNRGAYRFQQNYVTFNIDTIVNKHNANVELVIEDENIRIEDSLTTVPFKLYKVNKTNIFIADPKNPLAPPKDSVTYNDFTIYSAKKLRYRPKSLTDGIFVAKGNYFSDINTTLTSVYLSNLKVFNYPQILYDYDKSDKNALIAKIHLIPRQKYSFLCALDVTHSNIQEFGIQGNTSVLIRNVFHGAETFQIGARLNVGNSKDNANPHNNFFNVSEIGADAKLNFPRLLLPFKTDKIIPKTMIPFTTINLGFFKQTNIGLDKQNLTSALTYNWTPKENTSFRFDMLNIQYVRNLNPGNYYSVYGSSYDDLNSLAKKYDTDPNYFNEDGNLKIPDGVESFIDDVDNGTIKTSTEDKKTVSSIEEQQKRLTENNLIFASTFTFSKSTKKNLFDNNFYTLKVKLESAGNLLSLLTKASNQTPNENGTYALFGVDFSQYFKTETEYIKHWDLSHKTVLATRGFAGIAIPYGNSNSVPFSRSYFAGGSNDIRAWQSYSLGPGRTEAVNDYNEANLKLTMNAEIRYKLFQSINVTAFIDSGNIWHVNDIVTNPDATFTGFKSLKNIAIGTGFGANYDFGFFIIRLDLGFKTYNPAREENEKWFKEMRFDKSVLNIGINYPF